MPVNATNTFILATKLAAPRNKTVSIPFRKIMTKLSIITVGGDILIVINSWGSKVLEKIVKKICYGCVKKKQD